MIGRACFHRGDAENAQRITVGNSERFFFMHISSVRHCLGVALVLGLFCGCSTKQVAPPLAAGAHALAETTAQPIRQEPLENSRLAAGAPDYRCAKRVISDEELWRVSEKDPDLSPVVCRQILARLNIKAHYYISDDIEKKRPLEVPNDFSAYKDWTPLPRAVPELTGAPKLILVAKDIFFLGWYEKGRLVGDTQICLGVSGQPTIAGFYKVQEKDPDHISRSYTNSFGRPAWMPWSMRIYEQVWIHAGDITGAYCSHGCVTLPLKTAEELFRWAEPGTPVVIVESLADLGRLR